MAHVLYGLKPRVVTTLGKYTFKKPLEIDIYREIDDGLKMYVAENDYLSFIGAGETVKEALESFEMHIDASVYGFGHFKPSQVADSTKVYVKRWEEYIDMKKMYRSIKKEW